MSKNINQIPTQATSILASDKMYIGRSPFGATDDRYILGSDIIAQLASPLTTKGDLYGFSTVDARLPVAVGNGKILQVDSSAAVGLSYSTPTYPSASGASGKVLASDGTNIVYSTSTFPVVGGAAGNVLISDGTNYIASTSLWPNTVGTALHLLISNGTSNVYSTPAYPNASVTTGKFIISDGTNYIASTSIMPNTVGSVGKIIRSDGTVNAYSTATFADTYSASNILYSNGANTVTGLATLASAVLVTDGSGVPSLSTTLPAGLIIPGYQPSLTLPLSLANGGTNANLTASAGGIFYSTGSAGAILSGTATASQILMSGSSAAPSWSTTTYPATNAINTIMYASSANVLGSIAAAASSVLITSAGSVPSLSQTLPSAVQGNITVVGTIVTGVWNGSVIDLAHGGSNANLTASNGGIVWSNATQMQILAGTATAGQMLQSGSTAAPTWSTTTWPATSTAGRILYSTFNNTIGELAPGTSGNVLTSNGTIWTSAAPADAQITITDDTTTNATMYPTWVTANTGTLPLKVSSTKMSFNPSTGNLTLAGKLEATTAIADSGGLNALGFTYTASAVNYVQIINNITGATPVIETLGSDSNISLQIGSKGTGSINLVGNGANIAIFAPSAGSPVNYLSFNNNTTGTGPSIASTGSDASVPLLISSKNGPFIFYDSSSTISGNIRLNNAASTHYTQLSVATAQSTDLTLVLPAADGTASAPLITDGSGNLSFLPGAWVDFSGSIGYTGFTGSVTTTTAVYKKIGKTVFIYIACSGTSNSTGFTITGLPFIAAQAPYIGFCIGQDAGTNTICSGNINSTTLTLYFGTTSAISGWTNSGAKGFFGSFFYETT